MERGSLFLLFQNYIYKLVNYRSPLITLNQQWRVDWRTLMFAADGHSVVTLDHRDYPAVCSTGNRISGLHLKRFYLQMRFHFDVQTEQAAACLTDLHSTNVPLVLSLCNDL